MDLLGKEGEKASEHVTQVAQKVEEVESHVNAVDSALQDFMNQTQHIIQEELALQDEELRRIQEAADLSEMRDIQQTVDKVERMESRMNKLEDEIENLVESDMLSSLENLTRAVKSMKGFTKNVEDRMKKLEEKIESLEGEMIMEKNNMEWDMENVADQRDVEELEESTSKEIQKLRSSINILAEELGKKNDIEVE